MDVAAEQTSFIRHEGLDANSLATCRTFRTLLVTNCEDKALSLVSLVPCALDLKRGEYARKSVRAKVGIAQQRS